MKQAIAAKTNMEGRVSGLLNPLVSCFLLICCLKTFICYSFFEVGSGLSLIFTAVSAVLMFAAVLAVFGKLSRSVRTSWILLIVFFAVSYLVHKSGLEYICNTVIFLGLLTVLPYLKLKYGTAKILTAVFVIYGVLLILFASKSESDASSLINLNTNTSGTVLYVLEFCFVSWAAASDKSKKILFYLLAVLTVVFQYIFLSRSSFIGTACLILYLIFRKSFVKRKQKTVRNFIIFICLFAVLFAYLYSVTLYNAVGHGNIFIFGKDIFSGRQIIWADAFEQLKNHWFLGIGNTLDSMLGDGTNLHNQMLGYITCFGIFVFAVFVALISMLASKYHVQGQKNYCGAFIFIWLIMSFFETNIYSSLDMYYIPIALVIIYFCDKKVLS